MYGYGNSFHKHKQMPLLLQPVFLSKKERAELALKKRQEEVDAQKKKIDDERSSRSKYARDNSRQTVVCTPWSLSISVNVLL